MAEQPSQLKEAVVQFGPGGGLCGILTYPPARGRDAPGVLLLNAGMVHRVGPHRFYVTLARQLARHGCPVLRFDFSGLGDSEPRTDGVRFERSAVAEARAGMDLLANRGLGPPFVLGGLCNGAEMSFKTACADPRVLGVALINPQRYLTEPSREVFARLEAGSEASYYWSTARFKPGSWRRLVMGRSDYRAISRALRGRLRRLVDGWRRTPADNPDAAALDRLHEEGVRVLILFSEGDPGVEYLAQVAGDRVHTWRATGRLQLETLPGADHTLTPLASQNRARQAIVDWVLRLPRRRTGRPEISRL